MKSLVFALFVTAMMSGTAHALEPIKGPVVLTVKGAISHTNQGDTATFDMEMLEALPGREGTMETPWTTGNVTFKGPLLREVLKEVGAKGSILVVRALNDYSAEVPVEDADLDTILATHLDGKYMSIRDKGPLMLVYPFDQKAELFNEKYFGRSVWQIKEIEVIR
ncbi:molybdopterin-dependent oxidoreductase [Peteryoungia desertarenae]|uniref:Molybdopterin-dependent oxidoreductase n=1 Tax=Peteryoungia desertarenae TaxID=1813451 RepID=A0ABX6QLZ0_9HYPH|nr:molybdopterin-dependent oxidoreductase [Peteryoungia desertarenae]QLF69255.1 molybdopterin-dependent oxidoreductase [Peteryoungia desertarenae]